MILKSHLSRITFQTAERHTTPATRVAAVVASILLSAPALAGQGLEREVQFDIPRQSLEEALIAFSRQADVQLLVDGTSLRGRQSEALSGRFAVRDALSRLLRSDEFQVDTLGDTVRVWSKLAQVSDSRETSTEAVGEDVQGREAAESSGARVDPPTMSTLTEYRVTTPEVLIIGSRSMNLDIRRTEDDVQPYVVFDREQIERSAATDLEDFFKNHLPMNTSNFTLAQLSTAPSLAGGNINLRGLGANQTLILVDGQRLPGTTTGEDFLQPDITGIPLSSVERIEVLPATASGIYGGGATGGVINIIRKQDYSGIEVQALYGNVFDADARHAELTATGGWSFGQGTNISFSASYSEDDPLMVSDRDFSDRARALYLANNPGVLESLTSPPPAALANVCAATQLAPTFSLCSGAELILDSGQALGASTTFVPSGYAGAESDGGAALAANAGQYNLDVPGNGVYLRRAPTKDAASLNVQHQFNQTVSAFLDLSHNRVRGDMTTGSIGAGVFVPADDPGNPFQQGVLVSLRHPDLRLPGRAESTLLRAVGGINIWLPRDWAANLTSSWSRARTEVELTSLLTFSDEGRSLLASAALRDLGAHPVDIREYLSPVPDTFNGPFDTVLNATALRLSGPAWELPGGSIGVTAMVERRKEKALDAYGENQVSATAPWTWFPERSQSIDSYYLESRVPLVGGTQGLRFAHSLELLASVRRDEYETVSTTDTPGAATREGPFADPTYFSNEAASTDFTLGLRYAPVPELVLRASVGTGFLAPSLSQITPLEVEEARPIPLPFINPPDPRRGNTPLSVPRVQVTRGNPELQPEESESWSAGVIITPRFLDGLRLSIDYTRISKTDEIFLPLGLDFILENEAFLPGRVVRGENLPGDLPGWAGPVTFIDASALNLSRSRVESYDLQLDYQLNAGSLGRFYWSTVLTRMEQFERQVVEVAQPFDSVGYFDGPLVWRGQASLRWERGPWMAGWSAQYFDNYSIEYANPGLLDNELRVINQGSAKVPSQMYHDLFMSYRFEQGWWSNTTVSLGIQNAFNKSPPILATSSIGAFGPSDYSQYGDPRLRRYTLSIRKAFGQ